MSANSYRQDPGAEAGFTLLELLISMTLLGFLTIALYGGLNFGTRVWDKAQSATTDITQIRRAQMLLKNEIAGAYPRVINAGDDTRSDFEGSETSLRFLAPAPPDIAPGGFARVSFEVIAGEEGMALLHSIGPELGLGEPAQNILINGLEEFSFSYLGGQGAGDSGSWQESWQGRVGIPKLIRVRASLKENMIDWPDLIIETRVAADAGCVYDALKKFCRGY